MATTRAADGTSISYSDEGAGPAVVLVHGLGGSGADWAAQREELSTDHRVVAVDLRGHGRSQVVDGPYSMPLFAGDVAAVIDDLGIAPAHVVGLSLGGGVAFQVAVDRPELVASLTIVNSGPHVVPETLKERAFIGLRLLTARLLPPSAGAKALAGRLLPGMEHERTREELVARMSRNDKQAYYASARAFAGWSVMDRIADIDVPVLVLHAEHDYTPAERKREYVQLLRDAELIEVPDSRHALPIERPAVFTSLLRDFLVGRAGTRARGASG